ncbi:MAG TPA: mechanosensitive ion channel domain-containing protein [Edaphocola sp.]|nr:mechanosensitive ion channel domain-containing protein [Edaphocola sp.]
MQKNIHFFYDYFIAQGISQSFATLLNMLCLLALLGFIIYLSHRITQIIIVKIFSFLVSRTKTNFDDLLLSHKAPKYIATLIPLFLTFKLFPIVLNDYPSFYAFILVIIKIYTIFILILILRSILRTLESFFKLDPRLKDKPIDSYIQVFMLFLWAVGIGLVFAVLTGISLLTFFTTLGAASAILLLIFKDTIMGLVASIQVAINDSVRIGDWITMDKHGADGDVVEINLSTVQVQNWDKTITYLPTHALMSDAFINWRGMQESGGRRIKRSILIKAKSIHYLSDDRGDKSYFEYYLIDSVQIKVNSIVKKTYYPNDTGKSIFKTQDSNSWKLVESREHYSKFVFEITEEDLQ